jgi:YegS/Rv2252/BmrU family lipid kinase
MHKTKIYVIINPVSGIGSKKSIPEKFIAKIDQEQFDVHFFITGYAGHANDIAQEAVRNKVKYVVAVGGDGTINEVARALVDSESILGIIPFGSGNGLARDLHISTNVDKAIKIFLKDNVSEIDYGVANDHVFFCTCGMGFDAIVSENFSKERLRGPLTYFKNVLGAYIDFEPENYEVIFPDGKIINEKAFLITCANTTQYGNNAFIAPRASLQDGLMNIAILKPFGMLEIPQTTIQLFSKNIDSNKNLTEIITKEAIIRRTKPGWIHIDGDPLFEEAEVRVRLVSKGLKVVAP